MTDVAIKFTSVSKRFERGELHRSLRDLVPAVAASLLRRGARPMTESRDSREFWSLRDINLEVRQGETLGVVGHNGAGKSTMLKHLAGIMTPTSGRIEVRGRLAALIEVGAGFHHELTGRENVYLSGAILGMSRAEVTRKFDAIVDFAGMSQFIDTPVKRYSSGMFARLGFAVAAHLEPDILVIDEVLSVGDFVFQQKSLRKMREVATSGATVIFVSHNLKAVAELCRRSVLLDTGTIVEDGPTSDVLQTYLDRERRKLEIDRDVDVAITGVQLLQEDRPTVRLRSGSAAQVRVTFTARRSVERVAVAIGVLDEGLELVFHTSDERLGSEPSTLAAGETSEVTFDLTMHLANGTFHLGAYLYRYDIEREFDRIVPAGTFFVEADRDARGVANLYPTVRSAGRQKSGADAIGPGVPELASAELRAPAEAADARAKAAP